MHTACDRAVPSHYVFHVVSTSSHSRVNAICRTVREERSEDERYVGDRGQEYGSRERWEPRERTGYRYEDSGAPPPPPRGGGAFDDHDYDFAKPRGYEGGRGAAFDAPQPPPPPGRRQQYDDRYAEPFYDGGRPTFDSFDDRPLFPPPPPPKSGAGAHNPGPVDGDGDEEDLERKAFEEELARVAAELEKVCPRHTSVMMCIHTHTCLNDWYRHWYW
jgi:hypothetical protein